MRTKSPQLPEKMLEAAARLFGGQRFHEVRMEDIAAEAEVGKGTLYRYFRDKEELYIALLARASTQLLHRIQEEVDAPPTLKQKLTALVDALISFFDEQPHLLDLIQRTEVLRGPNFPWQRTRDELLRLVMGLFAEGSRRQEFTIADDHLAALMLLAGLRGVIRFGKRPRPRGLARRIVEALLNGFDQSASEQAGSQ